MRDDLELTDDAENGIARLPTWQWLTLATGVALVLWGLCGPL